MNLNESFRQILAVVLIALTATEKIIFAKTTNPSIDPANDLTLTGEIDDLVDMNTFCTNISEHR